MQAVWRGRKARMRIKSALLAARYQDDELDDLLGYEELNMDETLLSYEEYLAPFALRGGWQFSLPYPEQTENLHGTRMVKALAGGWVAGGLDCSNETSEKKYEGEGDYDCRDISSSHSISGPLVYGDHRRRSGMRTAAEEARRERTTDAGERGDTRTRPASCTVGKSDGFDKSSFAMRQAMSAPEPRPKRTKLRGGARGAVR